jgi:hypothetical protein
MRSFMDTRIVNRTAVVNSAERWRMLLSHTSRIAHQIKSLARRPTNRPKVLNS